MSAAAMDDFAALANQGVEDIRKFLGIPASGGKLAERVRFFVGCDVEISFTQARSVFLPAHRVRNQCAPYLHETFHALAPCRRCPLWFSEGVACYVQSFVSEHYSGYDAPLFTGNGNAEVDRDAARWLAASEGKAVLPFIAKNGEPRNLRSDRERVASPFYALSHSFTKFLAQSCAPSALYRISLATNFKAAFRKQLGAAPLGLRERWLERLRGRQ